MVSGPDHSLLLQEFEGHKEHDQRYSKSHEQGLATLQSFKMSVNKLCETISSMGNSFLEESLKLMTLDNHDCVDKAVLRALHTMETKGKDQYARLICKGFHTGQDCAHYLPD